MLQRNLHLAMAGVISVGLAMGILTFSYRDLTINAAKETKFRENEEIARALSSANWALVEAVLDPPAGLSRDELRNRPEVALLREVVEGEIRRGMLTKVKVYNLSGLTVFSTAEAQIGEDYSNIREISTVLGGETITRIKHPKPGSGGGSEHSVSSIESYVPLRDPEDGSIRGVYEIYANITAFLQRLHSTEDKMFYGIIATGVVYALLVLLFWRMGRESQLTRDFLDAVFENHPDMLLAKSARDLRYVRVNKATRQSLGEEGRILGKLDHECFSPAQAAFFSAMDREVRDSRQPLNIQAAAIQTKDQGARTLRLRKVPIGLASEEPRLILAIAEDITEQQRAAEALEASEERYRKVVDHAGDGLFLHRLDGRFVDVNARACESLGYTREELLRLSVRDVGVEFKPDIIPENWGLNMGEARAVTGVHRRKDGTTFPVEVELTLVSLRGDLHVIALARDITERMQAERELKRARERAENANQEKSNYVARLGHGLRTPLHAVTGMTDLLLTTSLTKKQRNYVETIRTSGELLGTLINDTLDFARVEAGNLQLAEVEFSLGAVVEGVVNMMGYRASEKRLELVCLFETDVTMPLVGDPDHLGEVLVNLVGNAVKFTHQGTVTVSVSLVAETDEALVFRFSVQDTGIGISPEGQAVLFKPFTQAHKRSDIDCEGSGLGLSISRKVIEAMGGEIEFESQLGEGSSFWFEVPLRKSTGAGEPVLDPRLENRRVLAVARHPAIRQMLSRQLRVWQLRCDAVTDAAEAWTLLGQEGSETGPYELAVMDLDGQVEEIISLVRRIQSEPEFASMRVILLVPVARSVGVGVISSLRDVRCLDKPVLPSRLRGSLLGIEDQAVAGDWVEPAPRLPLPTGSHERQKASILVAEDNPVNRGLMMDLLDFLGYEANAVADGPAVIEALAQKDYDAVLLDCQMPGMDGDQVAVELYGQELGRRPLLIAVTADASAENLNRCKTAGMDDILTKPLGLKTLANKLEQWLPAGERGPAPPPAPAESAVDGDTPIESGVWKALMQTDERRPGFVSELVRLFLSDAESRLQAITSDIESGRFDQVLRDVHALRAGCLQIGAKGMAALCEQLHQSAKAGQTERAVALYARLRDESEQVRQFLAQSQRLN